MFQLATRAVSLPVPDATEGVATVTESYIQFHRRALERQRDLLLSVWRWYLGPLVPGLFVLFLNGFLEAWDKGGFAIVASLGRALLTVLVFFGIAWLNRAGAKGLEREIDALGTVSKQDES